MNFATKNNYTRIFVWLIWFIALLTFNQPTPISPTGDNSAMPLLVGVVSHNPQNGTLFPGNRIFAGSNGLCRGIVPGVALTVGPNGLHGGPVWQCRAQ
ncbi:MAG: hypothetical protein IPJ94_27795 [Chloroflexi bacterium]|nr:hypothetical protein [Chloroflexota bacterium]